VGSSSLLDKPHQNNRYYVGEAAGLQDLAAGFGIRYAIISGYLAADSIITGSNYNEQISKKFKLQSEFERKRSTNLQKLTNDEIDKIFRKIVEKFGNELTVDEYESMRGEI
jgi:flavin-dependent dehydrogenase